MAKLLLCAIQYVQNARCAISIIIIIIIMETEGDAQPPHRR